MNKTKKIERLKKINESHQININQLCKEVRESRKLIEVNNEEIEKLENEILFYMLDD